MTADIRAFRSTAAATLAALALSGGPALAQSAQNSIGQTILTSLSTNAGPLFALITGISWVTGLWALASGLSKLSHSAESNMMGNKHDLAEGVLKLMAGIFLIAMPDVAGIGMNSLTGGATSFFGGSSQLQSISQSLDIENGGGSTIGQSQSLMQQAIKGIGSPAAPTDCIASTQGITCMASNIAKNAVPAGIYAIYICVLFAGVLMVFSCLTALTSAQFGHGKALPPGFWAKALVALLLLNGPWILSTIITSVQGSSSVITLQGFDPNSALLSYSFQNTGTTPTNTAAQLQKFADLIGYLLTILAFFGVWAFFKGLLMLKSTAEGKQSGTYGHGFVFMIGGVLLANAKATTCTVLFTMGGQTMTYGFCGN